MPIDRDNAAYEHRQLQLLRDILLTVKDELENADLAPEDVAELTARIGYAVASALDGEGTSVQPRLAFGTGAAADDLLLGECGAPLHELVYGLFEQIFDIVDEEDGDEEEEEEDDDFEFNDEGDGEDDAFEGDGEDETPTRLH
jgi:hypothetical protein